MSVYTRKMLFAGAFGSTGGGAPAVQLQAENTLPSVYKNAFNGALTRVDDITALLVGKGYSSPLSAMTLTLDGSGDVAQSGVTNLTGMSQSPNTNLNVYKIEDDKYIVFSHNYNTSTYAGTIYIAVLTLSTMALGTIVTIPTSSTNGSTTIRIPNFHAEQIDADTYLVTFTAGRGFGWSKVSVSGTTITKTPSAMINPIAAQNWPSRCKIVKTDTPNKYIFCYAFSPAIGSYSEYRGYLTFDGTTMSSISTAIVGFLSGEQVEKVDTNLFIANSGFYAFDGSALSKPTALALPIVGRKPFCFVGSTMMDFESKLSNYKLYNVNLATKQLNQLVDNNSDSNIHTIFACIALGSNVLAIGGSGTTSFGYALYEIV